MIISRYLKKEISGALLAVTFVLLLIFLSHELVRYLGYAASGKWAANILLQLMGFDIPYLLALLLPLGLYLGIILAYGRLYAESEMRVLQACGVGVRKLLWITGTLAGVVSLIVLVLMLWLNPWIANQKGKLIARSISSENVLDTLMPGRFQASPDGKRVVYVEKISRSRADAENLFIAEQTKKQNGDWVVVSANQGGQQLDPVSKERLIVASDGFRYEGTPGQKEYQIIQFKKYSVFAPRTIVNIKHQEQEAISTASLWKSYENPGHAAELQWRFSIALSAFLLAFIAIPLSQLKPRQSKYAQLLPAVLIYLIYVNLLFVARNWIEQRYLPVSVGMWWVHLIFLMLAGVLIFMQAGWLRRVLR
jgi:lipopolysaccharide export system permease protein